MDKATFRRSVYSLLMLVTGAVMVARIVGVEMVYEPSISVRAWPTDRPEKMPTFSSNDRSRWSTVRALVEEGTFVVGRRHTDPTATDGFREVDGTRIEDKNAHPGYYDEGIAFTDGYKSVDYILNPNTNEFFSSKPPLFTVVVAGEYWLLNKTLGWTFKDSIYRWPIVCTVLITFNVIPLLIFLKLLSNLLEEYGKSDWGRLFVFAAACFGTFLTTFAVTLNNHTPAACCVLFAIYPLLRGRSIDGSRPFTTWELIRAGLFAGLAFTLDLPAASFTALLSVLVLKNRPKGLIAYGIAALVPLAALVYTNYLAIGEVTPAYDKFGTIWYEYEGSHWKKAKLNPDQKGIDFAKEPKTVYAFHMLLGHHGLFSLTPIWLLALIGMIGNSPEALMQRLNRMALALTGIVIAFYIYKTNNYGGWTSGPRWQFWLTPLFLLAMIGPADRMAETAKGRRIAMFLLAVAVFSAVYPVWNPWRHPWAYQLCEYMNWVKY